MLLNPVIMRKIFNFQEVLEVYPDYVPSHPHASGVDSNWFTKLLTQAGLKLNIYGLSSSITSSTINDLIDKVMTIVYDRHADDYIYYKDLGLYEDYNLNTSDFYKYVQTLLNILELTASKYIPLLQKQVEFSVDPVAKLQSTTTGRTRFNDTPESMGDYDDEEHASNISNSINQTEVDSGSIVSRLDEAFKNWRSIILEWSNEMNMAFFKEEQL